MTISAPLLAQGQNGTNHINALIAGLVAQINAAMARPSFTTAALPAAATLPGAIVEVTDGNAGSECLAFSDGAAWHRLVLGAAPNTAS